MKNPRTSVTVGDYCVTLGVDEATGQLQIEIDKCQTLEESEAERRYWEAVLGAQSVASGEPG